MTRSRLFPLTVLFAGLLMASPIASAVSITFDEPGIVPFVTENPGFNADGSFAGSGAGVFQFSSSQPIFGTTVVENLTSVSGNSLTNGFGEMDKIYFDIFGQPVHVLTAAFAIDNFTDDVSLVLDAYDANMTLLGSTSVTELATDPDWSHTIKLGFSDRVRRFAFYTNDGSSRFWIDNVEAHAPEPATFLLLSAGIGGLAVWSRRRRGR